MLQHHSQAHERDPGSSAFLKFLTQLSDDAWSQVLLPQLQAKGSVADVAQTCRQLRDLCYGTVKHVDLKRLRSITEPLELGRVTQHLIAHFPACSSVWLTLDEADNYHCVPYMLPALRRYVMYGWATRHVLVGAQLSCQWPCCAVLPVSTGPAAGLCPCTDHTKQSALLCRTDFWQTGFSLAVASGSQASGARQLHIAAPARST